MRLLLHVGPPKTGSSSIQLMLAKRAAKLEPAGVMQYAHTHKDLPLRVLSARYSKHRILNTMPVSEYFDSPKAARDWSETHWLALEQQVGASDAKLCVLSSEHFGYGVDVAPLLERLNGIFDDITVVFYARDPLAFYFSHVQQSIKGGMRLARLPLPQSFRWGLPLFLKAYQDVIGAENIIVRNFARDNLVDGDVVQDFLVQMRRFVDLPALKTRTANESISGAATAFLLMANEITQEKGLRAARKDFLRQIMRAQDLKALPAFKADIDWVSQAIGQRTRDAAEWINQTYLQDQIPLSVAPPQDIPDVCETEQRDRLRDTIMGFVTPEAMAAIARVGLHAAPAPQPQQPPQDTSA